MHKIILYIIISICDEKKFVFSNINLLKGVGPKLSSYLKKKDRKNQRFAINLPIAKLIDQKFLN